MKKLIRQGLGTFAAFASLGSGLLWHLSAKSQIASASAIGDAVQILAKLSLQQNLWAAYLAAAAGVAVAIAIIFND